MDIEPHRLQRQRAANVRIGRPIHHSHCALAKLSGYYVAPNLFGSHRVLIVFVFIQTKSVKLPAITEKHCKHSRVLLAFDPTGDQSTLINSVTNGECPMRRMLIAFVLCASFACAQQVSPADSEKLAIRHLLQAQVDAWNAHDLEGFMKGYWRSPDLTFFSGANATTGWQTTLDHYRQRYQGQGKEMGKLDFYDLYVDLLGTDAAFVRGHWHLAMKSGKEEGGLFTLVLKKFPEGWRIVHDHTS